MLTLTEALYTLSIMLFSDLWYRANIICDIEIIKQTVYTNIL